MEARSIPVQVSAWEMVRATQSPNSVVCYTQLTVKNHNLTSRQMVLNLPNATDPLIRLVPHAEVTPKHKVASLLLHQSNVATLMNPKDMQDI